MEYIRREMYNLRFYTMSMENVEDTEKYFNSYSWANKTPATYHKLLKYLEQEHTSLFERLENLNTKNFSKVSLEHSC